MTRQITLVVEGNEVFVEVGARIGSLLREHSDADTKTDAVAALVNNDIMGLDEIIDYDASVTAIGLTNPLATRIYRRTLCFVLSMSSRRLFPDRRLVIGHALGKGYYYEYADGVAPSDNEIVALKTTFQAIVDADKAIEAYHLSYDRAIELFEQEGFPDTALLLRHRNTPSVPISCCGDYTDLNHGPLLPKTGHLRAFDVVAYGAGLVLRYPPAGGPLEIGSFDPSPLLFDIYQEYKRWGRVLALHSVGRLNELVRQGRARDYIQIAEALHAKKIARIAEVISERDPQPRLVLIAGPSSSGKTTFTKRLAIELRVLGYAPELLSLDDYFLPRELTPRDKDGNYDFESLRALDVELLNDDLLALFKGHERAIPQFDFKTGSRKGSGRPMSLSQRGILLVEGIHALNGDLTSRIARELKHTVYVSALTQLNLDDHNRISTTDNRLIRRMVRDHQFRGHTAEATLEMWPSVRHGEDKNIFPFQDHADSAFNSALDYELAVLKAFAEPLLGEIKPRHDKYHEARRLLSFLSNFVGIPDNVVHGTSILREFIGRSDFKY